jgi:WD repeat-containing protein 81
MSAESLLWLAHRLGPVLTARYVTKNLLKMLTLCYVSQENLLPSTNENLPSNIGFFSVSDGQVVGDENAIKVLDCLTSISALFGEHFILCQYLPHVTELVALCKKKITTTLEGGLISCIQLIKFVIPCMSDATIMEQLQDNILKNIIKPVIRLLNSTHFIMPSGFLARGVLARKLIDLFYVLTVRIGTEIAREHLCVPHMQRFFLIFDKAYGIEDPNDSNPEEMREKGIDELKDVFTPSLAHSAYLPFVRQFGENVMRETIKNLELILNLCHEYEVPNYSNDMESLKIQDSSKLYATDHVDSPHSFGTNVNIVGNRLDYQNVDLSSTTSVVDLVAYKLQHVTSNRQLKGNWLAYWTHEIGRPDKDQTFNLKQIKLQTFSGHTNSIRGILCLDNENSFMSASKDRTVKLWSLRSEGDGSKISSCQFTYMGHRKSVHSLAFLDSMRLAVSCDSGVHLWDPFVGAQVNQIEGSRYTPISIVRTYPGPSSLVLAGTADSTIKVIDARIADYVLEWKLTNSPSGSVRCLTVAPSGNWIAIGLSAGQIVMIDGRTGVIQASWKASEGELLQMQAPNDNELITSSLDNSISVWNANSGSLLYNLK